MQKRQLPIIQLGLVYQYCLKLFQSRYNKNAIIDEVISNINTNLSKFTHKIFKEAISGKNQLGKQMRKSTIITDLQIYLQAALKNENLCKNKCETFLEDLIDSYNNFVTLENVINFQNEENDKHASKLQKFPSFCCQKLCTQQISQWKINKKIVDYCCQRLKNRKKNNIRKRLIVSIYDSYLKDGYMLDLKYSHYQLAQYLLTTKTQQFENEFQVKNDTNIQQVINILNDQQVINDNDDLKLISKIVQHIEKSKVYINFSYNFQIDQVPDQTIIDLLQNIENRLQLILPHWNSYFLIIRRVSDNTIFKSMIEYSNNQKVEQLIQQCQDGQLYDIVMTTKTQYNNIGKIKVRYLNIYYQNDSYFNIKLDYPQELITLAVHNIKLSNIDECVNLTNIYDDQPDYLENDITQLHNIKRLYSNTEYNSDNKGKLLQNAFQNNKLEYISVNDRDNVALPIVLSQNTEKIHYINTQSAKFDLQFIDNSLEDIFNLFVLKYIDKNQQYQNINFLNIKWVIQQIGEKTYRKYLDIVDHMNIIFDNTCYKCRLLSILLSTNSNQQKLEDINTLAQDSSVYIKIQKGEEKQIQNVIDVQNLNHIFDIMQQIKTIDGPELRIKFLQLLHNKYEDCKVFFNKHYEFLPLINHIISLNEETFKQQFQIENTDHLTTLFNSISSQTIKDLESLKYFSLVCKYLEYSSLYLQFNQDFAFNSIPDEYFIRLFDNIENRLFMCDLRFMENYLLIIRDINTNKIYKIEIIKTNIQEVEKLIITLSNSNAIYDVILSTNVFLESIGRLKIRYLNYINYDLTRHFHGGPKTRISLMYPKILVSASLHDIFIENIYNCVNLENLSSRGVTYKGQIFWDLRKLKRIYSNGDRLTSSNSCFLYYLFQNSKPEYVRVWNGESGNKIVKAMRLVKNIENLRYFKIEQAEARYDFTLSVALEFPKNLRVFDIKIFDMQDIQHGILDGPKDKVENLRAQLLNFVRLQEPKREINEDSERFDISRFENQVFDRRLGFIRGDVFMDEYEWHKSNDAPSSHYDDYDDYQNYDAYCDDDDDDSDDFYYYNQPFYDNW